MRQAAYGISEVPSLAVERLLYQNAWWFVHNHRQLRVKCGTRARHIVWL